MYLRGLRNSFSSAPNSVLGSFAFCWIFVVLLFSFTFTGERCRAGEDKALPVRELICWRGRSHLIAVIHWAEVRGGAPWWVG